MIELAVGNGILAWDPLYSFEKYAILVSESLFSSPPLVCK